MIVDPGPVVRAAERDAAGGVGRSAVLALVDDAIADVLVRLAVRLRGQLGAGVVVLGARPGPGATDQAAAGLRRAGFLVQRVEADPDDEAKPTSPRVNRR